MPISPVCIATWKFGLAASLVGWQRMIEGASALDAVEAGARVTENDPDVNSVGFGGLPNAEGVVELDAAIMNGVDHAAGAVGGLIGIGNPLSVARRVMEQTPHVMLVGEYARRFALREGFPEQEQLTPAAALRWQEWQTKQRGPDVAHFERAVRTASLTPDDHDTIGICALDAAGNLAVGCTTSGMAAKVPGRVGDSPIIGAGLYVDNQIGAASATGHGDEMMKACLSYRIVMNMERGLSPQEACIEALRYLLRKRPPELHNNYGGAVIALRMDGEVGGAATLSGFAAPDRLWQWAVASSDQPQLREGVYVTADTVLSTLGS